MGLNACQTGKSTLSGAHSGLFTTSDVEWLLNEKGLLEQFSVISTSNNILQQQQSRKSEPQQEGNASFLTRQVYQYDSDDNESDDDQNLGVD